MNLSTGRVLVVVALVVAGLAILANGFGNDGTSAATTTPTLSPSRGTSPTETSPPPTSAPPTQTPAPNKTGVLFMALNGTDVLGAGAAAQKLLTDDGYKKVADAVNAPTQGVPKTTVYFRADDTGQNEADANYVAKTYFEGATVKKLNTDIQNVVEDSAAIVIVVGADWATKITS